jgi:hypothetical protein
MTSVIIGNMAVAAHNGMLSIKSAGQKHYAKTLNLSKILLLNELKMSKSLTM